MAITDHDENDDDDDNDDDGIFPVIHMREGSHIACRNVLFLRPKPSSFNHSQPSGGSDCRGQWGELILDTMCDGAVIAEVYRIPLGNGSVRSMECVIFDCLQFDGADNNPNNLIQKIYRDENKGNAVSRVNIGSRRTSSGKLRTLPGSRET